MRIRNDFVSNSSSSSYVLTPSNNRSNIKTIDVARIIVLVVDSECAEYKQGIKSERHVLRFLRDWKNKDFNDNIAIPWTVNYETFIYHDRYGNICIPTSRNHEFGSALYPLGCEYVGEYIDERREEIDHIITRMDMERTQHHAEEKYSDDLYEPAEDLYLDLSDLQTKSKKRIRS